MLPTIREKSVFGLLLHKIEKETPDLISKSAAKLLLFQKLSKLLSEKLILVLAFLLYTIRTGPLSKSGAKLLLFFRTG